MDLPGNSSCRSKPRLDLGMSLCNGDEKQKRVNFLSQKLTSFGLSNSLTLDNSVSTGDDSEILLGKMCAHEVSSAILATLFDVEEVVEEL